MTDALHSGQEPPSMGETLLKTMQETAATPPPADPDERTAPAQMSEDAYFAQVDPDGARPEKPDEVFDDEGKVEPSEPTAEETTPTPEVDTDLEDAMSTILRDGGWTKEELEALPPERVLYIAAKRHKVQTDTTAAFRRVAELEKQLESLTTSSEPSDTALATEGAPDGPDLHDFTSRLAETLSLDEGDAEVLAESFESMTGHLSQEIAAQQTVLEEMLAKNLKGEIEVARQGLGERFPELLDDSSDRFVNTLDHLETLWETGKYEDVGKAFEAAAVLEYMPEIRAESSKAKAALSQRRANGQATPVSSRPEAAPLTPQALEDKILNLLDSPDPNRFAKVEALTGKPFEHGPG